MCPLIKILTKSPTQLTDRILKNMYYIYLYKIRSEKAQLRHTVPRALA